MAQEVKRLESDLPTEIPQDKLKEIVEKAKDWALMHGVGMHSKTHFSSDSLQFVPFILLPSPFPRKVFQEAVELQTVLNELTHKVAHSREFLSSTLKETVKVDEFTANLYKIYETVQDEGVTQPISLGLLRSDLMLETSCPLATGSKCKHHAPYCCWKQVEINSIASGFGWLGPASAMIQRYVMQELGLADKTTNLPENNALQGLCNGMLKAWKLYENPQAVFLFIIDNINYIISDQRYHEFEIRRLNPNARVIRRTLTEMAERATLGPNNELVVDGLTVAVIYFRAGYEPAHYPTQKEWDARLLMERSQAIKSPSIHYQLAGMKKVQQALAKAGAVEMFLGDARQIGAVKKIFAGLYSLDFDEIGDQAVQMALDTPEIFVLKPQREGGGNNIYGSEVREAMLNMKDTKERSSWILMEKITPPLTKGYVVRPGGPEVPPLVDLASELGIFGVIIGDSQKIMENYQAGHVLRTKVSTANEGGVAAGLGALDSPYMIDL